MDNQKIPKYGFKVHLDHKFPERRKQSTLSLRRLLSIVVLIFWYLVYYITSKLKRRKPFMDYLALKEGLQIYGVPLGGIGCGTIGRGFKGEFCRYQMVPGMYEYNIVHSNQFIVTIRNPDGITEYQKVLSTSSKPKHGLGAWDWGFDGADGFYCGLYPRSWTVYNIKEHSVRLICRQVSPVIPHNYKDSSLPVGVFIWTVENNSSQDKYISITLCLKNGTGSSKDRKGGCWSECFTRLDKNEPKEISGVVLNQNINGMPLTYGLAVSKENFISTSYCLGFDPNGRGEVVWNSLKSTGHLSSTEETMDKARKEERCIAVCGQCKVKAHTSSSLRISMAWYMPNIVFGGGELSHRRIYTRWFSNEESGCQEILEYSMKNCCLWEEKINEWQQPVLNDPNLPDWFKSAIFNELYYISDGGSVWLEMPPGSNINSKDPRSLYGRFGYLESHEYRMYNTYDVHFYASWALIMLWPHLQESLQYDFAMFTTKEDLQQRRLLSDGKICFRSKINSVPHDLGDPDEEPFLLVNAFNLHSPDNWRDLNLNFILQVYRDFAYTKNEQYLKDMWPVCCEVLDKSLAYDTNSDGLIENSGHPDQTFDMWTMHGASAYCSSLWISALAVMVEMSEHLNIKEETNYNETLVQAKRTLHEKLWNGKYFNFDSCSHPHSKSIMSAQLVGQWYLSLSNIKKEIIEPSCVKSTLKTLFDYNVMKFKNGQMGAINGMYLDGTIDRYAFQSDEMWTGITYSIASLMIIQGMEAEGFRTAEGVYKTVYEKIGMGFETPEALTEKDGYRAIGYMRPLSIWSILQAYLMSKSPNEQDVTLKKLYEANYSAE